MPLRPSPASLQHRLALHVLQLGAVGVVLAALPYKAFDLERYAVPKELVLHLAALVAVLLCLRGVDRLRLTVTDFLLLGVLALSLLSTLGATNWWLAFRALGISLSSLALFWSGRAIGRAGLARPLAVALAGAAALGALTAVLQAYGITSSLISLNRAPGGTFGNRNFMAHLVALGLPMIVLSLFGARRRSQIVIWSLALGIATVALVLSRSRAAWLGFAASQLFLFVAAVVIGGHWRNEPEHRRGRWALASMAFAILLALALPNSLDWRSESPYLDSLKGLADFKEGSGKGRLAQYRNTFRLAEANPILGVGPGNWPVAYPGYAPRQDPSIDSDDGMTANPWPSSDGMAFLSERGFPAAILLVMAPGSLIFWQRRDGDESGDRAQDLYAIAATATLIAAVVEGGFDAVLLLPAPALFVWTLTGALAVEARPRWTLALRPSHRRMLIAAVAVTGGLLVLRSGLQVRAMAVYNHSRSPASLEYAARLDPASYRIQMILARSYHRQGRCEQVRVHAEAAEMLFPNAPEPKRLLRACAGRR